MTITATEFKTNFGKYLDLVNEVDIFISKNGKIIAQLSKPQTDKIKILRNLVGIGGNDSSITLDEIKSERLKRQ